MVTAKMNIAGRFEVIGADGEDPDKYEMSMVITFDNAEDMRAAIKGDAIKVVFG